MKKPPASAISVRGMLIHATHYDPKWCANKAAEEPFDVKTAVDVLDAMARVGMNLLMVDCEDGVRYRKHPELARPYSVPMADLSRVAREAAKRGIEVVPKCNFSKSSRNRHDMWLSPHWDWRRWMAAEEKAWPVIEDVIAELVAACKPKRFFNIGMDEDHDRSVPQYVACIKRLRSILRRHGLRTVIWNDSCHNQITSQAQVYAEKSLAAEPLLPKDIVHGLWKYDGASPADARRLTRQGFEVWAAPGAKPELVAGWRRALLAAGGSGLLLTTWTKCAKSQRDRLIETIETLGPAYED